ncbi:MAG: GNAT family N-acetyltransferase [Akkermansiaceae bacterium]
MINYRQTTKDDESALSEIFASILGSSDTLNVCPSKISSGWVACNKGKPVGLSMANREEGELVFAAVLPEFAGQGIGRNLMKQAEAWLFSHGWEKIRLVIDDNAGERADGFFLHLGWEYEKTDGSRRYYKKTNPQRVIALEEHIVEDKSTGYTRIIRLQRAPSEKLHRLCLFLDGEHYWRDMGVIPLLKDLMEKGELSPMTLAFVGHVSGAARQEDYICTDGYSRFIGSAVMPWLADEVSSLQEGGHLICGLSLSGLMAVYQTLRYPQHFEACLSQSGSHWWEYEWFAEMARKQAPTNARFWLSAGDKETETNVKHSPTLIQGISQIKGVSKAAELLEEVGGAVRFNQYQGGHSLQCWHDELGDAMAWLTACMTTMDSLPNLTESQSFDPTRTLRDALPSLDCKGVLLAVSENGKIRTYSAGSINQEEQMRPYYIYSISKTFTAIAIMRLCQGQGVFLDEPFSTFFPETTIPHQVTTRQLLNHTSGLSDYFSLPEYRDAISKQPENPWSYEKLMQTGLSQTPLFPPGEGWAYSNPGYGLLKELIEQKSGTDYYDYLSEIIIKKAGLTDTRPFTQPDHALDLLEGEDESFQGDFRNQYHPGWILTGCLISTASDVAKFYDALFAGRLISHQSLSEMTRTVDIQKNPPEESIPTYGLGLMHFRKSPLGDSYGHGGGGPGYTTYATHFPDLKGNAVSISLVINKSLPQTPFNLCDDIVRKYLEAMP